MKKVDLVVPGLFNLPAHEINKQELEQSTPCLHRLLRFANQIPNAVQDFDKILLHRLGLEQGGLPYAYAMNKNPDKDSAQVLFKPVYLKSDINNAIVFPVNECEEDTALIINDLSDYFKEDCSLTELPENTWAMTLHHCQPPKGVPHYLTATGKKVTHYLQQAKSNLEWYKLFNEMQMFLFQHELNQKRLKQGLPIINSLWCWGADDYSGEFLQNTQWFCDDVLMQSLGRLYTGQSLPITAIGNSHLEPHVIIIDLSLLKALKGDWNVNVLELLQKFENDCLQAIMLNGSSEICLYTGGDVNVNYKPWMAWKFWKTTGYTLIN